MRQASFDVGPMKNFAKISSLAVCILFLLTLAWKVVHLAFETAQQQGLFSPIPHAQDSFREILRLNLLVVAPGLKPEDRGQGESG